MQHKVGQLKLGDVSSWLPNKCLFFLFNSKFYYFFYNETSWIIKTNRK